MWDEDNLEWINELIMKEYREYSKLVLCGSVDNGIFCVDEKSEPDHIKHLCDIARGELVCVIDTFKWASLYFLDPKKAEKYAISCNVNKITRNEAFGLFYEDDDSSLHSDLWSFLEFTQIGEHDLRNEVIDDLIKELEGMKNG